MALMDQLVAKAKANKQRIVLAEGTEPRTIQARQNSWVKANICFLPDWK